MLQEFYDNICKCTTNEIICINETSLNSFIICQRGHSVIGTKCIIKTSDQRVFKKHTGILQCGLLILSAIKFTKKVK